MIFYVVFFQIVVRIFAPSCALKLTPEPENLPPEASRGVLERLLWLRAPLGFVLGPFWVDLVLDFVTFSADFGINFAIFLTLFSNSLDVCLHCVLYLLRSTTNPKANISWPGGLRGAIK